MCPPEPRSLPPKKVPAASQSEPGTPPEAEATLVLVVEDEPLARVSIRATLLKAGFLVVEAESGEQALGLFDQGPAPDVVILDIGLPGLDGFQVCQAMRKKRADTAILMLTARADPSDKITGLTLGADDYLVKPFNPGELVARIRAVLRRSALQAPSTEPIVAGDLRLDPRSQKAYKRGVDANLSPREFALLAALLRHPGQVMSREKLAQEVWGPAHQANARALDVFVCKLRDKIEDDPDHPFYVKTAWGAGYISG
ncbi:MAG: response regulator transcription factor [Geothrix sp.]|uniref:response regulator transcription factor n=1 Tax=Geothrix sp. TaxID=1962974 RepID=UPI0017BFBB2E|nr:response regulator transcription factor [Geothrix sp.]NWJ42538.1 response regulator transcription factor [Geothrix sp.]WIL19501.1 MAG: response regulator transcription factor [Geothrix sp.]